MELPRPQKQKCKNGHSNTWPEYYQPYRHWFWIQACGNTTINQWIIQWFILTSKYDTQELIKRPTVSKLNANQKFHNANGKREPTICPNLFHWLSEKITRNIWGKNVKILVGYLQCDFFWVGVGGKRERCRKMYLSWRYELYSRIVGIASSHHKINLYITTEFRGGIQRQNFKKNVLSSTVKNTMQRLSTWMKRQGPSSGCHSSLSHCAGVNWPNVRFTWCRRTIKKITRFTLSPLSNQ